MSKKTQQASFSEDRKKWSAPVQEKLEIENCPLISGGTRWDYKNFSASAKKTFGVTEEFIKNEEYYWSNLKSTLAPNQWVIVSNCEMVYYSLTPPSPTRDVDENSYTVLVGSEVIYE